VITDETKKKKKRTRHARRDAVSTRDTYTSTLHGSKPNSLEPATARRPTERSGSEARRISREPPRAMAGRLVSMLRWPPDLGGLPSQVSALLPSSSSYYESLQERLQWDWGPEQLGAAVRRWPELVPDVPFVVDAVLWGVITAVESVALVSMVCCFFLCCGCTL